ncbi:unnamed protein product [Medioppia subpectinata]|uniref:FERM domain-containing protein n=1 Tax=Medioppia subpectinata TaxID=1979941 RepID=A0A7R9LCV2_9ACAR|nr:unnamed protein product [Medioppia subpectinata]CAG2117768.1 unnamed protein product [Medioppia subpectinata]
MLGIIEVDYFGLQYMGQRGEMLWINMRNQIKQQTTGANTPPLRFQLKVKFFVPPHLLLQEVTRHQFYISIVQDLQEGRLRVNDKQLAIKLVALIAQSETGDLDSEVTSALLSYRKWIPLSILENEDLCSSPTPQRTGKRRKHHSGSSGPEMGSENEESFSDVESNSWTTSSLNHIFNSSEFSCLTNSIIHYHQKLESTKPTHAKYLFLQEVANLEDIGVEYFFVKLNNSTEDPYKIGVGPKGVTIICEETHEVKYT